MVGSLCLRGVKLGMRMSAIQNLTTQGVPAPRMIRRPGTESPQAETTSQSPSSPTSTREWPIQGCSTTTRDSRGTANTYQRSGVPWLPSPISSTTLLDVLVTSLLVFVHPSTCMAKPVSTLLPIRRKPYPPLRQASGGTLATLLQDKATHTD